MKTKGSLGALVGLNLVLLAAIAVLAITPAPAAAQFAGRGSSFVMVAGEVEGLPQQAGIYILNVTRGELYWVMYNSDNQTAKLIAARNLVQDLQAREGR